MISLMLVGRATNRQVYKCVDLAPKMYVHVHTMNVTSRLAIEIRDIADGVDW